MNAKKCLALFAVAVLVMFTNIAISILYMVIYGHIIDPGHEPEYYEDHIQIAAPYCSIVMGMPLMFAAGWMVSRWWNRNPGVLAAIYVWCIYASIDLLVLIAVGLDLRVFVLAVVSFLTKLAAVYLGARRSLGRPAIVDTQA